MVTNLRCTVQERSRRHAVAFGLLIFAMSLLAGCGGGSSNVEVEPAAGHERPAPAAPKPPSLEEKLMAARIETLEKIAEQYENVSSKKSTMSEAHPAIAELQDKLRKLNLEFEARPQQARDEARAALGEKMSDANMRMRAAKSKVYQQTSSN